MILTYPFITADAAESAFVVEFIDVPQPALPMPPAIVRFPAGAELVQRYAGASDPQFVANLYFDLLERKPDGSRAALSRRPHPA